MSKKKNRYANRAKKKSFMSNFNGELNTKGDIKNSLLETGKELLVTVIIGGVAGAAIGKPSLLIGAGVTGAGHYTGNKLLSMLGIGMMAANGFQSKSGTNGLEGLDGVKERVLVFKENFSEKLYLDKILKKKDGGTSGMGEIQYFTYPGVDMAGLDAIEKEIANSGANFYAQIEGNPDGTASAEYEVGMLDATEIIM
jgi:hypothetical protein